MSKRLISTAAIFPKFCRLRVWIRSFACCRTSPRSRAPAKRQRGRKMDKLEHFDDSRRAIERSNWMARQALVIAETSENAIVESMKLVQDARHLTPTYRTETE